MPNNNEKDISMGERINELLVDQGKLQKELAEKVGITEATMSRYINNKREPKGTILGKIADTLGVSAAYLLGTNELLKGDRIPDVLKELGVAYIEVVKKAKDYDISAEELEELVETIKRMKRKK